MTREDLDFIGSMNMCDEISNDAYKKIVCHCEEREPCEDCIDRQKAIRRVKEMCNPYGKPTIDFESGKEIIKLLERMPPQATILPTQKFETVTEFADRCRECGAKYNELLKEKNNILDKIRAEIEELDGRYVIGDYGIYGEYNPKYVQLRDVLNIIDRYMAESEV